MDDDTISVTSHQPPQEEEDRVKTKEELKEEEKQRQMNRIERLQGANPPLSIPWSVGDSPIVMTILQTIMMAIFAMSLYCTYIQYNITADNMCDPLITIGPYFGTKNNTSYACDWPQLNVIIRLIAPAFGLLLSLSMIPVTICWGRKLQKSLDAYNEEHFPSPEDDGKKVEYYLIYNKYCFFRLIRRIFSACSYVQFVSCGLDLAHYLMGKQQAESGDMNISLETTALEHNFLVPFIMGLFVAIACRFTHDAIYLQPKKKSYRCGTYTTYATTTRTKEEPIEIERDYVANERYHPHAQTAMSMTNGYGAHIPVPSHYDHAPVSSHYQYAPSVHSVHSMAGDHMKTGTVVYAPTA